MSYLMNIVLSQIGFWFTWILISVLVEFVPIVISTIKLYKKNRKEKELTLPDKLPLISIIIPVFNSSNTLRKCIKSIDESNYPQSLIQIICADNGSTDNSFEIFGQVHKDFKNLNMQWIKTQQGKSSALNSSIYEAIGTYIINIDSDGVLESKAIMNMVLMFENNYNISAMTGTIFTQKERISINKKLGLKLLQINEYFEYGQAFLSGRNIESSVNHLFTMAGAFSAFRKQVLLRTYMYDITTVGEDTDMTFQVRERLKEKVVLCPNAFFYVEPIENLNALYVQRQRWQRGQLEVTQKYLGKEAHIKKIFTNFLVRKMILDHTFTFQKMIWFFASFVLLFFGYSIKVLALSYIIIYFLYVLISYFNFYNVQVLLKIFPSERYFYRKSWWCIFTLPLYNLLCSWIRLIGIINSYTITAQWNSKTFNYEIEEIRSVIKKDISSLIKRKKNE